MKNIALVGLGKWGTNILRELNNLGCEVVVLLNSKNTEKENLIKEQYPNCRFTYNIEDINSSDIDTVFIATPMSTHYELAKHFLNVGKRVYVEKPITNSSDTAMQLLSLASESNKDFMVGLIFLYHECFQKILEISREAVFESLNISKTLRNPKDPLSSLDLFLDTFIHEMSVMIKLFGMPNTYNYNKDLKEMDLEFVSSKAKVKLFDFDNPEKIRKFEFATDKSERFTWNNDELFDNSGKIICKPDSSSLRRELNIFINDFKNNKEYIDSNNIIAANCVQVLEEIYNRF